MFDLPKYGEGVCLARMAELLELLAIDRLRLQRNSIVVTGSNGKGSTAAFCASIARAYGLRTGLFTSPHLFRFNERFQIDGAPIGEDDLMRLVARIGAAIADIAKRRGEQFGAFEAMFALACLYFQESECESAVFEAGIGGRYDPVRLAGVPVTCVTSVDYEHVELLGDSLELIVSDKSDACASGGSIIYGENCRSLRPHIVEYNRNRKVTSLFVRDEIRIGGEAVSASGQRFDFGFGDSAFADYVPVVAIEANDGAGQDATGVAGIRVPRPEGPADALLAGRDVRFAVIVEIAGEIVGDRLQPGRVLGEPNRTRLELN